MSQRNIVRSGAGWALSPRAVSSWWPPDWDRTRVYLSIVLGLLVWEVLGRWVLTDRLLFAPLSQVIVRGAGLIAAGDMSRHVMASGAVFFYGYSLGCVAGIVLGLVMASSRWIEQMMDPWVSFFYSTPLIAMTPFFIIALGIGTSARAAVVFVNVLFPVLINTFAGVRSADRQLLELGRAFNATPWQVYQEIKIPSAVPYILTGLRLGIGRGLVGVVVSEFFFSREGVGYLINLGSQSFDMALLFLGVMIFALAGMVMTQGVQVLERRLMPWRS